MNKSSCFEEEIKDTIKKANNRRDLFTVALLTDSHYTEDGTWDDTACNMQKVLEQADVSAIIHLGDFTDGNFSKEAPPT